MTEAVRFTNGTKVYPPAVRALDQVSCQIDAGEIHAFVGENGAGKSTLMKVLNGEVRLDAGGVTVFGRDVNYRSPADAMADGIGMVHQEILLVDQMTVWENIVLGTEPIRRFGVLDRRQARRLVSATVASASLSIDIDSLVGELSVGARQKVEIAKLLHRQVRILILDEPTAVLTPQEVPALFDELRRLRANGTTVCFISHHLDEVVALADRITVLRDGKLVATVDARTTTVPELARLMVDRDVVLTSQRPPIDPGNVVLRVRRLEAGGTRPFGPVSFEVHAHEIVGVAGVEGNGQAELVGALVGSMDAKAEAIEVLGTELKPLSILDRRRHFAYVPAERKTQGGALTASLVDNVAMTHHRLEAGFSRFRGWLLERRRATDLALTIRDRFGVVTSSVEAPLQSLSGGNQQKIVLGRELAVARPLIILDQPTRGVDVGSIEEIHRRILALRTEGRAVLLISADLDELLRLSDRVLVLFRGRIVLDARSADSSMVRLGRAMLEGIDTGVGTTEEFSDGSMS